MGLKHYFKEEQLRIPELIKNNEDTYGSDAVNPI